MNYQTIEGIYEANDNIRGNLKQILSNIPDDLATRLPDGEKWTIANVVEHLALVENGMMRISVKLLNAANEKGEKSDGKANISDEFLQKIAGARDIKVEAPDTVAPNGNLSIADSLSKMEESRKSMNDLRPMFETVGCDGFTFPHPAFGQMNANEWLVLLGGHEARHTAQIVRFLDKLGS